LREASIHDRSQAIPRSAVACRVAGVDVLTSSEHPALQAEARRAFRARWPEFILHDPVGNAEVKRASSCFPDFDLLLAEGARAAAGGWGVPLRWSGAAEDLPDGFDGALARALRGHEQGQQPDTLCAMGVVVASDVEQKGLAGLTLTALRERALEHGLVRVIAPVRPTLKAAYPLVPMSRFATWRRPDGLSIDPWIRTHERLGATVIGAAPRSMVIGGTVAEWEAWTRMQFPETGSYVVPEALNLIDIDLEADRGEYAEENLWLRHC
jgi:GNAT superfamily N-acetyltransferase